MEVGAQIKKYRSNMGISQEELAEKVYVSRQTVSNWETGKNYPDIHSVLLLSSVFNVSLDQLIKGDVEIMKNEIKETEIKKLNKIGGIYAVFLILTACCITVPVSKRPCHGQCTLLVLAKVFHTKNSRTVLVGVKIAQCARIA